LVYVDESFIFGLKLNYHKMKSLIYLLFFLILPGLIKAQQSKIQQIIAQQPPNGNYDESKMPAYTLPDPLVFNNGSKVVTKADWARRRAEIYRLFENEVYGVSPEWHGKVKVSETSSKEKALDGKAIRKEVKLTLINGDKSLEMNLLIYLPYSTKPVPVFVGYNFEGNQAVTNEPDVAIATSWMRNNKAAGITNNKASESSRGSEASRWSVKEMISRGYGLVTIYYGDADPDFDDGFKNGVHALYDQQRDATSWGTIAGWAWGLSRVMDYLEKVPAVDSKKVIVMGHSRLGKTALWAGASDKRFAIVISNCSGCGGAALSKRIYGETVGLINKTFPHWFCGNFKKYNNNEENLPVDQHELLALIAPRPLYVASAEEDLWADPKGEFLSCVAASPVYELLGMKGLPTSIMPPVSQPQIGTIAYHIRPGKHDVTLYDWQRYMDFADIQFKKK
jgi:hypothetical protein